MENVAVMDVAVQDNFIDVRPSEPLARDLTGITVAVIMLSIVMHGTSVTPLLDRFWRR